jgi:hypothetical protein
MQEAPSWDLRSMNPLEEIYAHPSCSWLCFSSFSSLLPEKSFGAPAITLSGAFSPSFLS